MSGLRDQEVSFEGGMSTSTSTAQALREEPSNAERAVAAPRAGSGTQAIWRWL